MSENPLITKGAKGRMNNAQYMVTRTGGAKPGVGTRRMGMNEREQVGRTEPSRPQFPHVDNGHLETGEEGVHELGPGAPADDYEEMNADDIPGYFPQQRLEPFIDHGMPTPENTPVPGDVMPNTSFGREIDKHAGMMHAEDEDEMFMDAERDHMAEHAINAATAVPVPGQPETGRRPPEHYIPINMSVVNDGVPEYDVSYDDLALFQRTSQRGMRHLAHAEMLHRRRIDAVRMLERQAREAVDIETRMREQGEMQRQNQMRRGRLQTRLQEENREINPREHRPPPSYDIVSHRAKGRVERILNETGNRNPRMNVSNLASPRSGRNPRMEIGNLIHRTRSGGTKKSRNDKMSIKNLMNPARTKSKMDVSNLVTPTGRRKGNIYGSSI